MKTSKTFEIDSKLFSDFLQFCELNQIEDTDAEFVRMFNVGFNIAKYGTSPFKSPKSVVTAVEVEPSKQETPVEEPKPKKTPRVKIIKN